MNIRTYITVIISMIVSTIMLGGCSKEDDLDNINNQPDNPTTTETISLANTEWTYHFNETFDFGEYGVVTTDVDYSFVFESDTNGMYLIDGVVSSPNLNEEELICLTDHFTYTFDGKSSGTMYMENIENWPESSFTPEYHFIINEDGETMSIYTETLANSIVFTKKETK